MISARAVGRLSSIQNKTIASRRGFVWPASLSCLLFKQQPFPAGNSRARPFSSVLHSKQHSLGLPAVCAGAFVKCCLFDTTKPWTAGSLCARLCQVLFARHNKTFTRRQFARAPLSQFGLFNTRKTSRHQRFFARVPVASASFV